MACQVAGVLGGTVRGRLLFAFSGCGAAVAGAVLNTCVLLSVAKAGVQRSKPGSCCRMFASELGRQSDQRTLQPSCSILRHQTTPSLGCYDWG